MTTKDLILQTALRLFAERGYNGVSMRELAKEVGIKAASIYNYFSSKEELFNHLLAEMQNRYEQIVKKLNIPMGKSKETALQYAALSEEGLQELAVSLFLYFAKDEFAVSFRKMLIGEKYRNLAAGDLFKDMFIKEPLKYQTELFQKLIEQGKLLDVDPKIMALQFYAPLFLLLESYDETQEEEIIQSIKKHVSQFSRMYVRR